MIHNNVQRKVNNHNIAHVINKHTIDKVSGKDSHFMTNDQEKIEKIIEFVILNPQYYKYWKEYRGNRLAIKSKIPINVVKLIFGDNINHVGFDLRTQSYIDDVIVIFNIGELSDINSLGIFGTSFPCVDDYIPFYPLGRSEWDGNNIGWSDE